MSDTNKTAAESTKDPIKPEVRELAAKLTLTIDPKTGLATAQEGAYDENLPEGLTPKHVKDLSNHNAMFVAAMALAQGEKVLPMVVKNDKLEKSELVIEDSAGNKFSTVYERSKLTGAPGAEKTEKFGQVSASIELKAARKIGQYGAVRTHLAELATAALAKKK